MSKKILVLNGSPRPNGNTSALISSFTKGAESADAEVLQFDLHRMEIHPCLGCYCGGRSKEFPCVQIDEMQEIYRAFHEADVICFASPLYFWTISSKIKAFIERFYCIAEKDDNPPFGRYEKYPIKDCALLMTAADDFFWTFEQAVSYYKFALINYIGFHDKGMLLVGGCGDTNGKPQIDKTSHLKEAYEFGRNLYKE